MNNSSRLTRLLLKAVIIGTFIFPAWALAHVATDIPMARQLHCYTQPDFWSGNLVPLEKGCNNLYKISGTYPGQQWNEVAKLIKAKDGYDYNDQKTVEMLIPDEKLCSANDPLKEGLNEVSSDWYKTPVTPKNGYIQVRIVGTAPHVSSLVKIYLSKAGFNPATTKLKWSDLDLVHQETVTLARTDWGASAPAPVGGLQGFFLFNVAIPSARTGDALLFTRFQRIDPDGEGFYNCSDITINNGGPAPVPDWFPNGLFQPVGFNPKPRDKIHFRVLGSDKAYQETVDIEYPVSSADPAVWGQGLVQALSSYKAIVQIGEMKGSNIVFNTTEPSKNVVFLADEQASKAMSIIPGGGGGNPDPRPPIAVIRAPTTVESGKTITLDGSGSTFYNQGQKLFQWSATHGLAPMPDTPVLNVVAPSVSTSTKVTIFLSVYDGANKTKSTEVKSEVDVVPPVVGDQYVEGTKYLAGAVVINNGKKYRCKPPPYTGWCAGAAWAYAPGTGSDWRQAWDEVQ